MDRDSQKLYLDNMFGELEKTVALEDSIHDLTHKEDHADLHTRVTDLESMMQIQQEQIEIINTIFQKVFGGLQGEIQDLKVAE